MVENEQIMREGERDFREMSIQLYKEARDVFAAYTKNLITLSTFLLTFTLSGMNFLPKNKLPISLKIVITTSWISLFLSMMIGIYVYAIYHGWLNDLGVYWENFSQKLHLAINKRPVDTTDIEKDPPKLKTLPLFIIQSFLFALGLILTVIFGISLVWMI